MGKVINLKSIHIENFKGISNMDIQFGNRTKISGQNAAGKTTILDAFNWCLFNTNSQGETKFEIRPLDEWGNKIHNIEIKVSIVLDIDGETTEFTKIQKENWVKHRGHEEAVLEGNPNSYEIDGYPKKEKDYNAFIQDIISADTFKMLADPRYFPNLAWKEQRKVLMSMCNDVSDIELAEKDSRFGALLKELKVAPSTDDIRAKYQKALTEYKKKLVEIPVRIDELSKSKVDIDVAELELEKKALEDKINSISLDIDNHSNKEVVAKLENEKRSISLEISSIESKAKQDVALAKANHESELGRLEVEGHKLKSEISKINFFIDDAEKRIKNSEKERTVDLLDKYNELKVKKFNEDAWKFDESSTVCSLCGQKLPGDKIEELKSSFNKKYSDAKANFEKSVALEKKRLVDRGNELKTVEADLKAKIETLKADKSKLEADLKDVTIKYTNIKSKIDSFVCDVDLSTNSEYVELTNKLNDIDKRLSETRNATFDDTALKAEKNELEISLSAINEKLASVSNNVRVDERIAELENEQKLVAQSVADQEKMIYLLEEFIKYKLDLISNTINSHFKSVAFRLFNVMMNGGLAETCECLIDGIPYSDANSGHKLVAGLDIIQALQNFYGISTVAFLDNAESLNTFNIPNMDNQLISLSVSEDKALKVEV